MKFKVGDRVRVKSFKVLKPIIDKNSIMVEEGKWLFSYEYSDGKKNELYFTEDMLCFCGQSAKIIAIMENCGRYRLEFDNKDLKNGKLFSFAEDWIEPYLDEPIYVSSFDDEEENKSERLKTILAQIEQLAVEARKIVEG